MATTKTTKTTKASKDTTSNFSAMTEAQLQEKLAELRQSQNDMKRSHAAGELANPQTLTTARRDIARVMTALSALKSESKRNGKDEDNA